MILHLIVICQNIIISLARIKDSFISLDGYTRLYYVVSKGYYLGGK